MNKIHLIYKVCVMKKIFLAFISISLSSFASGRKEEEGAISKAGSRIVRDGTCAWKKPQDIERYLNWNL